MNEKWNGIMLEVDRLYWINQTSEGRIACITDYIVRLLEEAAKQAHPAPSGGQSLD